MEGSDIVIVTHMPIARQRIGKHILVTRNTQATIG
jgi:hypothetical protein